MYVCMYIYFSYTKTQKRWLQQCRPKNLAALNYLPCTSKEYIILFCVYTYGLNIYIYIFFFFFLLLPHFYPLLLSPLSRSSRSSFLPVASFNSSTRRRTKPLASADNADWSLRSPPLSLCYLIFPLFCLSIFLRLKHQNPWSPIVVEFGAETVNNNLGLAHGDSYLSFLPQNQNSFLVPVQVRS